MKSNAKLTGFTVVAAAAFGMAAWMGCTTTSSTGNETDGGITSTPPGTLDDSGTGTTTDAGDGGASECTTNTNYQNVIGDIAAQCETCLQTKCCTAIKHCVDPALADAGGDAGDPNVYFCKDLDECAGSCPVTPDGEDAGAETACLQQCDDLAGITTSNGYAEIDNCAKSSCSTECAPL